MLRKKKIFQAVDLGIITALLHAKITWDLPNLWPGKPGNNLGIFLKKCYEPQTFFSFLSQGTGITIQGVIWRYNVWKSDHFNYTNSRFRIRKRDLEVILMIWTEVYDVQKGLLKVILMTRTEDTTYKKAIQKSFLWYELKIPHTKMRSRSHFNDMNGRYHVRISYLEVILLLRNEDTTCEKCKKKAI